MVAQAVRIRYTYLDTALSFLLPLRVLGSRRSPRRGVRLPRRRHEAHGQLASIHAQAVRRQLAGLCQTTASILPSIPT